MPKSGSVYIGNTLANGLKKNWSTESVAHGFFPEYFLVPNKLELLAKSGDVRQEHFDASPINLRVLEKYTDRLILNVRDPRQATLSWAHHAARLEREHPGSINYTQDDPPADLFVRPLGEQIDYHLSAHLLFLVKWCREWLSVADDPNRPIQILILSFEEFLSDPTSYCNTVARWWGYSDNSFVYKKLEQSIALNFRKGKQDEWRDIFSAEQKDRALDILGPDLMRRFSWAP